MKPTTLAILHLSDSHIQGSEDWANRAQRIAAAIRPRLNTSDSLLVAFTGDVAQSGQAKEYAVAERFLSDLMGEIGKSFSGEINVICVPGNHDCNLAASQEVRKSLIGTLRQSSGKPISEDIIAECCKVLTDFNNFANRIESVHAIECDALWKIYEFDVGGMKICVQAVNTAWSCERKTDPSNIPFPVTRPRPLTPTNVGLRVLMTHLPYHWIQQETYREFRRLIKREADIVLTGHEHELNSGVTIDTEGGSTAFVEGGALSPHEDTSKSSFSLVQVELKPKPFDVNFYHFEWQGDRYTQHGEDGPLNTITLNPQLNSRIQLSSSTFDFYHDLGASITHSSKAKVELQDLFVFPELDAEAEGVETEVRVAIDSKSLLQGPSTDYRCSLIMGEQASGKSALLKMLALEALDMGLVPIFLLGKNLARSSKKELQEIVEKAVREQYEKSCHQEILQLARDRVVLLVDNLDRYGFPTKYFANVAQFFAKIAGQLVATADPLFDIQEALFGEALLSLRQFDQYQIMPLGVKRRHTLVKKWFALNSDASRDEERNRLQNGEYANKLISGVLAKGLIPKYPIYVLILLQGIEAGHSNELENSALGQYYEYLIMHSLLPVINQESLREALNYCEQFAWYLHNSRHDRATDAELRQFHAQFEATHDIEVLFESRKQTLIHAKIWADLGGEIRFRYPYTYYFFLGRYLARNLGNPEVRALAESYAESLYVREHGPRWPVKFPQVWSLQNPPPLMSV